MSSETSATNTSPLSMSDADFLAAPVPDFSQASSFEQQEETQTQEETETQQEEVVQEEQSQDNPEEETQEPVEETSEETTKPVEETVAPTSDAQLEKLFAPFKANGREIKVDSVDEAIQLMQQGANYNKKMAALKPSLKVLKMLENNGLLDEGKLSFLIDIEKKNPDAIAKLIKDSGIDPLDVNVQEEPKYTPNDYSVPESQITLDSVLESIEHTPEYGRTMAVILDEWDDSSKRALANEPNLIPLINTHMANGIFDQIANEMVKQKALGSLNGLSDLQAYEQVGKSLAARGAFNAKPQPVETKPKTTQTDTERDARRKAASPAKQTQKVKIETDFNPLSMTDEEFEKAYASKFR